MPVPKWLLSKWTLLVMKTTTAPLMSSDDVTMSPGHVMVGGNESVTVSAAGLLVPSWLWLKSRAQRVAPNADTASDGLSGCAAIVRLWR